MGGAALTMASGLAVTWLGEGPVADLSGDALYAALVYLVLASIAPRARRRVVLVSAIGLCTGLELFQLTGLPATLVDLWSPARFVLGTTFDEVDLLAYAAGAALARLGDHLAPDLAPRLSTTSSPTEHRDITD